MFLITTLDVRFTLQNRSQILIDSNGIDSNNNPIVNNRGRANSGEKLHKIDSNYNS